MLKQIFCLVIGTVSILTSQENDSLKTYSLDPIVITATKVEIARSLATPSLTVISPEEIKSNPNTSIFSLISQNVPGLFVTERDILGFGVNSSAGQVRIRGIGGSPNNQILTLIDGRPQYMGWYGHPIDDGYLSTNIERVEVIRGPASTIYGSNAMGGVINILTHSTQADGVSGNASVSYGSFNAQRLGSHVGYQQNNWNVLASYTHEHTDGSRPWSEYTANSGYVKSSYRVDERFRVSLDGSITGFETFDPGSFTAPDTNNWMHIRRGYVGMSIENSSGISNGGIRLTYNFGRHELDPKYNFGWLSNDHLLVANVYQSFTPFTHTVVTAGIDVQENGGTASNKFRDFGTNDLKDYAGYVCVQQNFLERVFANAGVRYAHNSYFGDIVIPQAGVTYKLDQETNVRASIGKGYRAPQIFELYQLAPSVSTLQPEELWNYEVGFSHIFGQTANIDIAAFIIDMQNSIVDQWYSMKSFNIAGIKRSGIEWSGQWFVTNDLTVRANYSFTDKANQTISVPKHKIYVGAEYRWNEFTASLNEQTIRSIYGMNDAFSIVKLPDYNIVEAKLGTNIMNSITLWFGVRNLLNESYQTIYGYPMPGRTFFAGVNASI